MIKALVSLTGVETTYETNAVGPVILPPIEGSVSFNDVVLVPGNTLTATANITNPSSGTAYYEWFSGGGALNNTAATYTIQESDVGNFISVRVGTNKSSGLLEAQTASAVQSASIAGNVTISSTALNPSQVLSVNASFAVSEIASYKWSRDGTTQVGTSSTYTLQEADVGHTITLVVTRTGYTGIDISAVTSAVTWPDWTGSIKFADTNPASPIAGVSYALVVTAGNGAGDRTITWKIAGTPEADVTAANLASDKLSYKPTLAEKGKKLKVTVRYAKNAGEPKTVTSAQNVIPFTVKYNANGGTGTAMADSEYAFGDTAAKLRKNTFTKTGVSFTGWAATDTGAKAYNDEANISGITNSGTGTVTLYAVWAVSGVVVNPAAAHEPDLMKKFGIKTGSYALNTITPGNVTDTFNAVSAFIKTKNASSVNPSGGIGSGETNGNIKLGDYVDLGSLSVSAYNGNSGAVSVTTNSELSGHGTLLRLIVVGINPYHNKNGNGTATPHLVFQFQNTPGSARMNSTDTNAGGYNASEIKTYLTGNYWTGLQAAGVPEDAVWSPLRKVGYGSNRVGGVQDVSDKLYLPTEWEMFENTNWSENPNPTSGNQGRLAYYSGDDARKKYNSGNSVAWWFIADTPYYSGTTAYFCGVYYGGVTNNYAASAVGGCAPAFCVK